jgi:monovalent cation:H+ antiporter, CPA1 family
VASDSALHRPAYTQQKLTMSTFDFASLLLILAVAIGIANEHTFRLPRPVALLLGSLLVLSLIVVADAMSGHAVREHLRERIARAHLPQVLLDGLLALLLFAGSLQVDLRGLRRQALAVLVLATGSVVLAAFLFAAGIWAMLYIIGEPVPPGWCLVIGAVLAPTDAVAVEGFLARVKLPPGLRETITGESLFNDGAAVVVFVAALALVKGRMEMVGHGRLAEAILIEGCGGVMLGMAAGYLGYPVIRLTGDDNLATTISLALALSTYRGAVALDVSGPIAVVVAGMVLGSALSRWSEASDKRRTLLTFWPFIDETLNTLLYLLIGFEVLAINLNWQAMLAVVVAIPLALLARMLSVAIPLMILRVRHLWRATGIVTWAGLRGGISIALALILPHTPYRNLLLTICFGVVIFSVVVQGLLLPRVAGALAPRSLPEPAS